MKNVLVKVIHHEGGFFSNFNKVTTYLRNKNVVGIHWNLQGQPYGAFAYKCGEVFGKLFKEYNEGKNIDEIFELREYDCLDYTGKDVHIQYISKDQKWRNELNATLKYIKPTPILQTFIDEIDEKFAALKGKKIIGVLKRNELLKCEQVNGKLPTIEEYFTEIDKLFDDNTYICLSVDNITDINQFINKYSRCAYNPHIRRTQFNTDTEPHFLPGTAHDAIYTFLEVYMLSKCNYFIHPVSNMATAALYFNPELKSIYI